MFRILLILAFTILFLESCSSPPTENTPVLPTPTLTSTPLPPTITPVRPTATGTEIQLPVNHGNVETEYCSAAPTSLSIEDAQGLSEDEIVAKLMEQFLKYFYAPQVPDWCRIDGYRIEKIYYDERASSLPIRPKGDFMRNVEYSVKLIQVPCLWISTQGSIDQQNWLHAWGWLAVFRSDSGYTMEFARP